jgi:3-phenylpropionate/cinnamic acid dioxygenase small subunit
MNANEKLGFLIEKLSDFIRKECDNSTIPASQWEAHYKQLKAIRKFFGMTWDKIEKEIKSSEFPEKWIWKARKDKVFKRYYQLRSEIDEMEVLTK